MKLQSSHIKCNSRLSSGIIVFIIFSLTNKLSVHNSNPILHSRITCVNYGTQLSAAAILYRQLNDCAGVPIVSRWHINTGPLIVLFSCQLLYHTKKLLYILYFNYILILQDKDIVWLNALITRMHLKIFLYWIFYERNMTALISNISFWCKFTYK